MSELVIQTAENRTAFVPGQEIAGQVSWTLDKQPDSLELRLIWYTRGKGTTDQETVHVIAFDSPKLQDQREFRLTLPEGPYSFSGKLISLIWALELVALPGKEQARLEIVVAPNAVEVTLHAAPVSA